MKGVFLDTASMGDGLDFDHLSAVLTSISYHPVTPPNQIQEQLAGAEVAIVNKVVLGKAEFEQCPDLKLIAVTATGTNNIDLEAAKKAGVRVCNVIRYGRPTIVQHTFSLLLALSNNLMKYHADVQSGRWNNSPVFCLMDHPIQELEGKTLGIIGFGDLGQGVAKMAEAFGMHVVLGTRPGQAAGVEGGYPRLPLCEFLPKIDVLSLHCLLSDNTRNLIDATALAQMKPSALLINVARGGLVDEQALAHALRAGKLAGAAMDVLTEEPPRNGNILLSGDIPNLIITPHCAWASQQARQRLVDKTAQNIKQFIDGNLDRFIV
ncbi:MAG: D-2-hydroxyacid dehydrogenase [Hahellaceae bacterium]|nr:D-2-hydroxyacid dehydrogenase [Hahellaceae bacterium]MCP5211071.1 D-2-hydroxyacid dehydrogenase [Hahellaceae bacterium]